MDIAFGLWLLGWARWNGRDDGAIKWNDGCAGSLRDMAGLDGWMMRLDIPPILSPLLHLLFNHFVTLSFTRLAHLFTFYHLISRRLRALDAPLATLADADQIGKTAIRTILGPAYAKLKKVPKVDNEEEAKALLSKILPK
jgi:hypothetical protein